MSSHHQDHSLPDLLAQVDSLQQQLKDLGREVEVEENQVAYLEEMITKDQEKETKLRQDVSNISKELLEWEGRERSLAGAIESNYQSHQVLQQMEVEVKTKLSQERKKTDDLFQSLKVKFDFFQKKHEEEMEILNSLPGYVTGKGVGEKKAKLEEIKKENQKLLEEFGGGEETKKKDWEDFEKSCISLAETGLEANQKWEKLFSYRQKLRRREEMSQRSHSQSPTEDEVEDMETTEEEEEEAGTSPSQEEMLVESSVPPEDSQPAPTPVLSPGKLSQLQLLSPPSQSPEVIKVVSPSPSTATPSSDLQQDPAVTPALPSTPKTKTLQLGLGTSIMSSLRRGFREKSDSPAKDVEDVGEISSVKTPGHPQFNRSPAKTPKLKSFKLALPSFLKKKPQQDHSETEGETRVVLPVKTVTTATTITATNNNNNQSESVQSQAQKIPMLSPTRARPTQGDPQTPRVLPRLSLTKPTQRKEEAEGRRSLDQLTISGKSLGQIALKKISDPEKSNKAGEAEESQVHQEDTQFVREAKPRSGLLSNLQKPAGLGKSLGETLQKPKKVIAAAPEEDTVPQKTPVKPPVKLLQVKNKESSSESSSESGLGKSLGGTLQKPKKVFAAAPEVEERIEFDLGKSLGGTLQKPKQAITATPVERIESGLGKSLGGTLQKPKEAITAALEVAESEGSQEDRTMEWPGSPRQDDDQDKPATPMFNSPEQAKFLVSPTHGEDFFSDIASDFSSGFFGGGNDKEGGEEDNNFFGGFGSNTEDGGFSFFGDEENKDTDNDNDFFFRGEEKDDKEDGGGFNFF